MDACRELKPHQIVPHREGLSGRDFAHSDVDADGVMV